jgi:hypothetical protein
MNQSPFFEQGQIWGPEEGVRNGAVHLEATNSGTVLVFRQGSLQERRYQPWLPLARSSNEKRQWWELATRNKRVSVVDRRTGEVFLFNQGTWPLQDDQGQPVSETWMITNFQKGLKMGGRTIMEKSRRQWEKLEKD